MEPTFFTHLLAILNRNRRSLLSAFIMVFLSNVLLVVNPLLFRQAVPLLENPSSSPFPFATSLPFWSFVLIGMALTAGLLKYKMRMTFMLLSWREEAKVRALLFDKIQRQSSAFFDRHRTGDLLSRLTNDMTAYSDVLGPGIMFPIYFLTLTVPAFCALFWISWPLALLSTIPLFLLPALMITLRAHIFSLSQKLQTSLASLSTLAHEHYSGIAILKSYVLEDLTYRRFRKECTDFTRTNTRFSIYQGLLFPILSLIARITTVLLVLLAGFLITRSWKILSGPDFVSFMWIESYIFIPILMMGWVFPLYQRGKAAYARLVFLYSEPIEVMGAETSSLRIHPQDDIRIKNATFTYPMGKEPILHNLSLHIQGGSFVGITGPIGAGKTTLFKLLSREYEVLRNTIFFGDHASEEYPLEAFTEAIVQVEQIPFLFSRTVAENIALGKEMRSWEEIEGVVRETELHDTIHSFPFGYETLVGERGVTLSGGQKQRMAMARAFFVDRSILLLDDVFSAVDYETEQRIFAMMQKKLRGKTVLLITHRASVLEKMDRILYMMEGRIVEDGSPTLLRKQQGHYAALIALQTEKPA